MKKTLKIILLLFLLLIIGIYISQNDNKNTNNDKNVVRVGYLPLADHLPLMVAGDTKIFA